MIKESSYLLQNTTLGMQFFLVSHPNCNTSQIYLPKAKCKIPFEHATNSAISNSPHIASHEVSKVGVIPEKLKSKYVPLCGQDPANTTSLSPEDF